MTDPGAISGSTSRAEPAVDIGGLCRAIARGDDRAFTAVYQGWFDRTLALARAVTGRDESFGLDVVQEVMLRLIRAAPIVANEAQFQAWLKRTVLSASIDLIRREQRRSARELRRAGPDPADSQSSLLLRAEQVQQLRAQLDALPSDERGLLMLRVGLARTLAAVSAATGLSLDAVHGRVRRATDRLRQTARENDHGHS